MARNYWRLTKPQTAAKKFDNEENLPPDFADMVLSTPDVVAGRKNKTAVSPPDFVDMVLSTPDAIATRKKKAAPAPSLSPSKRGQSKSHYNDLESSPSKRRVLPLKNQLRADERKVLFTESTNNGMIDGSGGIFDLSIEDEVGKAKTQGTKLTKKSTRGAPVGKASNGARTTRSRAL